MKTKIFLLVLVSMLTACAPTVTPALASPKPAPVTPPTPSPTATLVLFPTPITCDESKGGIGSCGETPTFLPTVNPPSVLAGTMPTMYGSEPNNCPNGYIQDPASKLWFCAKWEQAVHRADIYDLNGTPTGVVYTPAANGHGPYLAILLPDGSGQNKPLIEGYVIEIPILSSDGKEFEGPVFYATYKGMLIVEKSLLNAIRVTPPAGVIE